MLAGKVPATVAPFLCGARLHAAIKKDGGLRPIAVGNLERRITAKCAASRVADKAIVHLSPLQLGVAVHGGCEAIAHAVRETLEREPEKLLLQADFINAFNTMDRATVLEEVAGFCPELLPWVSTCYGAPSHLQYGSSLIPSATGLQQGDALASFLFSLALHPVIKRVELEVPTLALHAWFLDDGTAVGSKEELQAMITIVEREGASRGLVLSTAFTTKAPGQPKSTVWSPIHQDQSEEQDPLQKGVPRVNMPGITLLGAPIGSRNFVRSELEAKVEKIQKTIEMLPNIQDPHTQFVLLRSCLALPKLSFILRTTDTSPFLDVLHQFDSLVREALSIILGAALTDLQWKQASLPVSMGGLGLRGAKQHGPGFYCSSVLSSFRLSRTLQGIEEEGTSLTQEVLSAVSASVGEEVTVEALSGLSQKALSLMADEHSLSQLKASTKDLGSVREVARLESLGLPRAGAWLNSPPIPALGLHLRATEFTMAVKLRLGCRVYDREGPCPACLRPSDVFGDHSLCCGSWGERITRHNHLRDHIHNMAASAVLSPVKEGQHLLPGDNRKPADVLIPNWARGQDAALDITIVHPLQRETVAGAAATPGYALTYAHDRKMRGASEACRAAEITFIPIVFESLGGVHQKTEAEVRKLASAMASRSGREEEEASRHSFNRLSILLMKSNAAILSNRIPSFPEAHTDGNLM